MLYDVRAAVSHYDEYDVDDCMICVYRCVRSDGRDTHREPAGEVAVCSRGVRTDSVPRSTDSLRQAAPSASFPAHRVGAGYRTALLRAASRQNADRHPHPGHAAQRRLVQLAVHAHTMTTPTGHVTARVT